MYFVKVEKFVDTSQEMSSQTQFQITNLKFQEKHIYFIINSNYTDGEYFENVLGEIQCYVEMVYFRFMKTCLKNMINSRKKKRSR